MNYVSVISSTVDAVAFDRASSTLGVRFKNGSEYEYFNVHENIYREMLDAASIGRYFDAEIRKAAYRFRKVG